MEKDFLQLYSEETKRLLWSKSAMDMTRNIAVLVLLAMILISFGFREPTSHRVPYFGSLAMFALVLFETRLFRFHAVSEQRIQLLEQNFSHAILDKKYIPDRALQQQLAASYDNPSQPSFTEAIAYRVYKNYFLIFLVLDACWLSKVYLSPQPPVSVSDFVRRLDLGFFSGWATVTFLTLFWLLFILAAIRIRALKKRKFYLHAQ
jgi:uncharacterized membrane protein